MANKNIYETIGFVRASKYRPKILESIGNSMKTPSDISDDLSISTSQVSNMLIDLRKEELVYCVNPDAKKGRMYKNTELALKVIECIEKMKK